MDGAYTDEDKVVSAKLLTLWTDFVKNGQSPTPASKPQELEVQWLPVTSEMRLEIGTKELKMVPRDLDLASFWAQNVWPYVPPLMSQRTSKSWKNTKLYLKPRETVNSKDEL